MCKSNENLLEAFAEARRAIMTDEQRREDDEREQRLQKIIDGIKPTKTWPEWEET